MPVRVMAQFAGNKRMTLGQVVVGANETHFKFITSRKPLRVMMDEENLLAVMH